MTAADKTKSYPLGVVGLVPMAGRGARIAPLPCSKELYPIEITSAGTGGSIRPKVVAQYLLDKMSLARIRQVYIVLRKGKWDIPGYFGDGSALGMDIAYLIMGLPFGPPYSMDKAYAFLQDKIVALGFADILFEPDDAFVRLLARQEKAHADMVLGLLPACNPQQMDMVEVDEHGRVRSMVLKPARTTLEHTWICAVWTPAFTQFMHEFLVSLDSSNLDSVAKEKMDAQGDVPIGLVIQAAIQKGLRVEGVLFPNGTYIDMGTPEGLVQAVQASRLPSSQLTWSIEPPPS